MFKRPNPISETLTTINEDILKIADQVGFTIQVDEKIVEIKHKFRLSDKSTLGILFFLFGGVFLIVVPYIKTSTEASKYIGPVLGLFILVLSILSLIRKGIDGIKISDGILMFRHNLKLTTIQLNGSVKVKMKTEALRIRRVGTLGSDFIDVTHYLLHQNKETPILNFQMDNTEADKAKKLGNEFTQIINAKFRQ